MALNVQPGISAHLKRDATKGVVNNQVLDWSYKLDGIFQNSTQEEVFSTVALNMVKSSLDGFNATLMCYGQTGAGKTFTITGATESYQHRGMIPRALSQLFSDIEDRPEYSIAVRISYLEIYNEVMYDLLATLSDADTSSSHGKTLVITDNQNGTHVKGLTSYFAHTEEDALNLLFEGETNRTIAAHALNRLSSRSHCIFTIHLEVSTLRFATRMMSIAAEPTVNELYDPVLLVQKLQTDISHLKSELSMHDSLTNRSHVNYDALSEQEICQMQQQCRQYLEGNLDEINIVNLRQIQGTFEAFRALYRQLEQEIEERFQSKSSPLDKDDTVGVASLPQSGLAVTDDDGSQVGETDRFGYGVISTGKFAKAEPSAVVQFKKKERERERRKMGRGSPVGLKSNSSPSQSTKGEREVKSPVQVSPVEHEKEVCDGTSSPVSSAGQTSRQDKNMRSSTPPNRISAFEDFKQDRGSQISKILIDNKEVLSAKKKESSEVARCVNAAKAAIDKSRNSLEKQCIERETHGLEYNDDGDIIISEDEFIEIQKLKELKLAYHTNYGQLRNVKTQVLYCQNLVDQCRQRLLNEFDKWYAECFLNQSDENTDGMEVVQRQRPGITLPIKQSIVLEDDDERFERRQLELMNSEPGSVAFHNARIQTMQRRSYRSAMSQPQAASHSRGVLPASMRSLSIACCRTEQCAEHNTSVELGRIL